MKSFLGYQLVLVNETVKGLGDLLNLPFDQYSILIYIILGIMAVIMTFAVMGIMFLELDKSYIGSPIFFLIADF